MDLTGQVYGAWTVIERAPRSSPGIKNAEWLCRCVCGNERPVQGATLRAGRSDRCRDCANKSYQTHGLSSAPVYNIWLGIKQRTGNPNSGMWARYGGRGITMDPRWAASFEAFSEDMGPRPSPQHSIDRIDNDGPYTPENCRWATKKQQARNTRRCVAWTYQGRTMTIADWAEEMDADPNTLRERVVTHGWTVERALSTPVKRYRR